MPGVESSPRRRLRAWWLARTPRSDTQRLTQANIYIVPTRAGFMFGATLVVLLLASINYQLNLGFVLTFLLAGSGVVSMHLTHATLRGLTLRLKPPAPVHADEPVVLEVVLISPERARHGIGLKVAHGAGAFAWIDVPTRAQASAHVSFEAPGRGRHELPPLVAETRFPLGLFRAWTLWRPASEVLVWPAPERPPAPLPAAHALADDSRATRRAAGGETEGVRAYRRGDALKLIVWKKAAKVAERGELVSRDTSVALARRLWLDWPAAAGAPGVEQRLSRLAAWVLAADAGGADYGLRLPGCELPLAQGPAHRRACLEALAVWQER